MAVAISQDVQWTIQAADPVPAGTVTRGFDITWKIWSEETLELVLTGAPTGLVGTLTISLETTDGTLIYPPTTAQIVEQPPASGRYVATVPNPGVGKYFAIWSDGVTTTIVELDITFAETQFVQTIRDHTPPARYDGIPWTIARMMEGVTRRGPYAEVETIALTPVDEDPSDPQPRTLHTVQATLTSGWWAIAWEDAAGHREMSDPMYATHVLHETDV